MVTLPKPLTSGAKSEGHFGKRDFAYLSEEDAYRCPAGERLLYRYTNQEDREMLRRYWTTVSKLFAQVRTECLLLALRDSLRGAGTCPKLGLDRKPPPAESRAGAYFPEAVLGWDEIPQGGALLPNRGVL